MDIPQKNLELMIGDAEDGLQRLMIRQTFCIFPGINQRSSHLLYVARAPFTYEPDSGYITGFVEPLRICGVLIEEPVLYAEDPSKTHDTSKRSSSTSRSEILRENILMETANLSMGLCRGLFIVGYDKHGELSRIVMTSYDPKSAPRAKLNLNSGAVLYDELMWHTPIRAGAVPLSVDVRAGRTSSF